VRVQALLVLVAIATISGSGASQAAADPWRTLYRPLKVPRLAPGAECPASKPDDSVDFDGFGIAQGVGPGPAYPVGLNVADGTLTLGPARNFGSRDWMGQKVLWFVLPQYRGPVLIRGRQVDGSYRVRFDRGSLPPLELRIAPNESVYWDGQPRGSRGRPSYTRLRAPGCYGYQIDGRTFSRAIVFLAVRTRS